MDSEARITMLLRAEGRWEAFCARREALRAECAREWDAWTQAVREFATPSNGLLRLLPKRDRHRRRSLGVSEYSPPAATTEESREQERALDIDAEIAALAESGCEFDIVDAVRWAAGNVHRSDLKPSDCPSLGHYSYWKFANSNSAKFFGELAPRVLTKSREPTETEEIKQERKSIEELRKVLESTLGME